LTSFFAATVGSGNYKDVDRKANDYYPTPPIATYCLLKSWQIPYRVWEPAAGRGHLSAELGRNGHSVVSTDLFEYEDPLLHIITGVDFLRSPIPAGLAIEAIVTNPPYKNGNAEKFISHAIELEVSLIAFLARLQFVTGKGRYDRVFSRTPPSAVMTKRVLCDESAVDATGIGGMLEYAWYVWDRRVHRSDTVMRWIDVDACYAEMTGSRTATLEGLI
jgi:hypothetical protein